MAERLSMKEYESLSSHIKKAVDAWMLDRNIKDYEVEVSNVDDNQFVVELIDTEQEEEE